MRAVLARHTMLNLAGMSAPLLLGLLLIPIITRYLGAARFGLLGLSWAVLEYFSLFDLGLGRATIRSVAERLARGGDGISQVVVVSIGSQLLLGVAGGVVLAAAAPLLAERVFAVPADLVAEGTLIFRLLGAMLPVALLALSLRGLLEGAQRFDLSNMIRVPSSAATFIIPALAAPLGVGLPAIVLLMLAARVTTCAALIVAARRALPQLRLELPREWRLLRPLLGFGGWVSVSNVASPLLVYLDRFVLGSIAGLAAVGYYTAPYEATTRLLLVPASLVTTLFPAVTVLGANGDRRRLAALFSGAVRNLTLVLLPPIILAIAFAPTLLTYWLGPAYAERSTLALRLLAVGVFANALAHVPASCLQALGRPDINAKFHVAELAAHVPLTLWLVSRFGIAGAAGAWAIRVIVDAALLFTAAHRVVGVSLGSAFLGRAGRILAAALGLATVVGLAALPRQPLAVAAPTALLACAAFALVIWRGVMDPDERALLRSLLVRRV
jgi:O-antigen/teichoic acid export membrane protein